MKEITPEQLKGILAEHKKWLDSGGKKGKRVDPYDLNLQGANLSGVNLQLKDLHGVNFQDTNLQGANLAGANLTEANLLNANLREADLQDADLTNAKGFSLKQLAGAKVSGIKLSGDIKGNLDKGLARVAEASKNARKIFQVMLLACFYALLTIATTTDVNLLTNSTSSPLPVIRAAVPIVWFYLAAPLFLLGIFVYFHLYLQRLWDELAFQPAVFPDGKRLDEKVYPWLFNGLACLHFKHLQAARPPLSALQSFISILLAWWVVPITLVLFWLRCFTRHDWWVTGIHIFLLSLSMWAGFMLYRLATATFRGKKRDPFLWKKAWKDMRTYKHGLVILLTGAIFFSLSLVAINGLYPESFPFYSRIVARTSVDFVEADVSTKPANWTGKVEDVKGARLRGSNLQRARASRAFLVKADLRGANLQQADLRGANLQQANLGVANLQQADLRLANLRQAKLIGANLQQADLRGANLQQADLSQGSSKMTISRVDTVSGVTTYTVLEVNLQGANLKGVDLTGVIGLTKEQIEAAYIDDKTKLPDYLQADAQAE